WMARMPAHWELREENAESPLRSAALPMGFNRRPQYGRGLLLVGDSGGMVSPWSGEGIVQAMEAGEVAAETVALALHRPEGPAREQALHQYASEVNRRWGRYYRLGNTVADLVFARYGYRPLLNRRVMASPALVRTLACLLTHGSDAPADDLIDSVVRGVVRMVPASSRRARDLETRRR
ncbi:FAD-dependent oxidoreductase, partial [Streptomyces sp. NPDC024062]